MDEHDLEQANKTLDSIRRSIIEMKSLEHERIVIEPVLEGGPSKKKASLRERWASRPYWLVPLLLYAATWASTTYVGFLCYGGGSVFSGLLFSAPLMTILTCHELGHYLQNLRYGIDATLPYFIPVPLPPLGTFGAIIQMKSAVPSVRALFDVGISGPLAGLVVTLVFLVIGVANSTVAPIPEEGFPEGALIFGEPLIFQWVANLVHGYDPSTHTLLMHPVAVAAWVGILLTTLNLFPIGQLDGGHIFYALTRKYAAPCSYVLFGAAVVCVFVFGLWNWALLLALLYFIGLRHPPTMRDDQPLGWQRTVLGWLTLAFIIVGFTARPLTVS
ncbi:MAG: site-2 protease family protein [Thermoguttaceae bacterium]|nr:site-2 protease family protein [Thermoguttaceae bacterium]